jgi:ribokinase
VVVGSLNVDYIASVERLPRAGETVPAAGFIQRFGGKGANQAIAAARQGARVSMIGCAGSDAHGQAYRQRLRSEGIGTAGIRTAWKTVTGTAMITLERGGENTIVVIAGANGELGPPMIRSCKKEIANAQLFLAQFEVPMAAVVEAIKIANRVGVRVVLNPSPLRKGFPWGKCALDAVIVNCGEAESIFGLHLRRISAWQSKLKRWRIGRVIITRGAEPTICINASGYLSMPTMAVRPVDTVGAGDTFAGTYVARRAEGMNDFEAIRYANCAGALATLKRGAQEAMPRREETERALKRLKR